MQSQWNDAYRKFKESAHMFLIAHPNSELSLDISHLNRHHWREKLASYRTWIPQDEFLSIIFYLIIVGIGLFVVVEQRWEVFKPREEIEFMIPKF
jgi:hypothetical protein